VKGGNFEIMIV